MFKLDSKTRILIVDDVADVRHDLRVFLEVAGNFQVVGEAENGQEAVEQARTLQPDIVIMDLAMPVLDGYAAATGIKTDFAGCRIAALTVHCTELDRLQAHAAGFDAFLSKGTPLLELLGAIRSLADDTNRESNRT
jgi:DNA-binding NarL/FixJ family response regulator